MNRSPSFIFILTLAAFALGSACSSAKKERLEQRDKLANSSGLYCDFVNGEKYTDVEVMMNLEMAKRCDSNRPFSISGYKSPSEVIGMMYCCALVKKTDMASAAPMKMTPAAAPAPAAPKVAVPAAAAPMAPAPTALKPPPPQPTNSSPPPLHNDPSEEVIGE